MIGNEVSKEDAAAYTFCPKCGQRIDWGKKRRRNDSLV